MKAITQTKTTHIAKVRQKNTDQIQQVCQFLQWTPEQYCNHQFEQYEAFIARMFEDNPVMYNQFRLSAVFRGFWNAEWAKRNEREFLSFAADVTEESIEVDANGKLVTVQGVEYGDAWLLDEYQFIHNWLLYDAAFMRQYNHVFKLIVAEEAVCK